MKKNIFRIVLLVLALTMIFGTVVSSAADNYSTYTYTIDGQPLLSPTAYSSDAQIDSKDMMLLDAKFGGIKLSDTAEDIVADESGNVYIADTGNNRIVILNKYYQVTNIINGYVDEYGKEQTFNGPRGVFVTNPEIAADQKKEIYVCDTTNERIVIFDELGNYARTLNRPTSKLLADDDFRPSAIAVDLYGRVFIVSETCGEGIIVMSKEGDFTGFIGAQKVTYSLLEMIWRNFQTKEQIAASVQNVAVSYNNITVDNDGFVFVTTKNVTADKHKSTLSSKEATYSPVKKLNSAGSEIMKRNGFFDPSGEVALTAGSTVSEIIDVSVGIEGSWSILDRRHGRVFTYDSNGNLLFAFGDKGDQLGNAESPVAIAYQTIGDVNHLLMLDKSLTGMKLTIYSPTEYCNTIIQALHNANEHNHTDAIYYWQDVLTRNNNFDLAYIGIGKALYSQGKYEEAMEMLASSYETAYYSKAFNEANKEVLSTWLLPVVILVVVLLVFVFKFLGYAGKKNKATSLKVGRKTYWEELLYAFHLVFHPFDGFWDLKHELRGSVRGGTTIMGITVIALFYNTIGQGYIFNPRGSDQNIFFSMLIIVLPVLLWCVSNWCLTCLFDGEGSFKDIYIATTYSLAPLPPFLIVATILTNFMDGTGASIVTLLTTVGFVWVGILLFFGMLVTHDYTIGKNLLITICTIVAMLVIVFVAVLFASLLIKMVMFIVSLFSEIGNRL